MIRNMFYFLAEQTVYGLLIFFIFYCCDHFFRNKSLARWSSFLWCSYFIFLVVPFKKIASLFQPKRVADVQVIRLDSGVIFESSNQLGAYEFSFYDIAAFVWILGALSGLLFFVLIPMIREFQLRKGLKTMGAEKLDPLLLPYEIIVVENHVSPFVAGLFKPRIYFPENFLKFFNKNEINGILLHEMAHILNRDLLKILFSRLVSCLFWFLPTVYFAANKMKESLEYQADEFALRKATNFKKKDFAQLLFKLSNYDFSSDWKFCGVSIFNKKHLARRLAMIKNLDLKKVKNPFYPLVIIVFSIFASIVAVGVSSEPSNQYVTLLMKVYDENDKLIARPSMISQYGETSLVMMHDGKSNATTVIEATVQDGGINADVKGSYCQVDGKYPISPGTSFKNVKCEKKRSFHFSNLYDEKMTMSTTKEGNTLERLEFKVLRGADTKLFLKNTETKGRGDWVVGRKKK